MIGEFLAGFFIGFICGIGVLGYMIIKLKLDLTSIKTK